ncbi:MAG: glycosyltransferase involved in cell wall biosynthesis [Planctomycetota bacterium]|jgi:glycosyltransferase involved in cell wall biosynthesis
MAPLQNQAPKSVIPGLAELLRVDPDELMGALSPTPFEDAPGAPKRSIAIVGSRGIPACYGGFETAADVLARRLVLAGHRVVVTCEKTAEPGPETYAGAELRYYAAPPLGPASTIVHDCLALWDLRREVDIIYLLGYGAAFATVFPRMAGTEIWINPDGVEWARAKWPPLAKLWFRAMEYVTMRAAHRVVSDAEALGDHLRARHKTGAEITTIAYGTEVTTEAPETDTVAEYGLGVDSYFLIVCRLEPENHILEAIEGYKAAGDLSMPLAILGNTQNKTPYVQQLLAAAEGADVRFIGTEYNAAKLAALRFHARAYVHGHSVGGTNPSLLEALGVGNLLLAHDNPFNREVIGHVQAEWFASPQDAARGYQHLAQLGNTEVQERRCAARKRAEDSYSWDLIATAYEQLLAATPVVAPRLQVAK